MQRVLSCYLKKAPPFSLKDLTIPEQDKMDMAIARRKAVSFSWADTKRIAAEVHKLSSLNADRKSRYATTFILASATGLPCSELFALRMDDLDFKAGTIRVNESFDGRTYTIGKCKNVAAYRTVFLGDREGREALRILKAFVRGRIQNPSEFVFHSKHGSPMRETSVLHEALHPALKALGLPTGWNARFPSWVQSKMGTSRDESRRASPDDGSQFVCDDGTVFRRDSCRTNPGRLF